MDTEADAIIVDKVSKSFSLPHEKVNSLKGMFLGLIKDSRTFEKQKVLKDISFEVKKGDFFGIVGRNGSGKSTLLKLLAGIYIPNNGGVHVNGTLAPFIELGVGFNPELTGRENVYLNGALLGFTRKQVDGMYNEIVEFAELENFMDQKLKNYSSGMQVRLAFSIAIRAKSDILLIDEVLAVGDSNFQRKCFEYFHRIKSEGRTVVFVTHDMDAVSRYCNKAILIDKGEIVEQGEVEGVIKRYSEINMRELNTEHQKTKAKEVSHDGNGAVTIESIQTYKDSDKHKAFGPAEEIEIRIKLKIIRPAADPVISFNFRNTVGTMIFGTSTYVEKLKMPEFKPGDSLTLSCKLKNIYHDDDYRITASVWNGTNKDIYDRVFDGHVFSSIGWRKAGALTNPEHSLSIEKK